MLGVLKHAPRPVTSTSPGNIRNVKFSGSTPNLLNLKAGAGTQQSETSPQAFRMSAEVCKPMPCICENLNGIETNLLWPAFLDDGNVDFLL